MKVKNLEWKIKEKVILLFNPVKGNKELKLTETPTTQPAKFAIKNKIKDSSTNLDSNGDNDYD
jgi:hypothetical protein